MKRTKERTWKKDRKKNLYDTNSKFYIFTEGTKTEKNYFNGFKYYIEKNPRLKNMVIIVPCGKETLRILDDAIKYKTDNGITNGEFWCVYDIDDNPAVNVNAVVQKCVSLNNKNKSGCRFFVAWSNECFEIWIILHFQYYTANNHRSEYYKLLDKEFQNLGLSKYSKNTEDIFDLLLKKGNPKLAIRYAKKLINRSKGKMPSEIALGTNMYELVEKLIKYLPDELKDKFV